MKLIKKYKYIITIILILLIILYVIITKKKLNDNANSDFSILSENPSAEQTQINNKEPESLCSIDIKGAIKKPGVYEANCNSIVNDIIKLAGGLIDSADTSVINLAKKITNEMVIIIYTKDEVKNSNIVKNVVKIVEKECKCPNIQNDGCLNTDIKEDITNTNNIININSATMEELQKISGIGEAKAKAIITYREKNGKFKSITDIMNVDGIGEKFFNQIKDYITVWL